jgi:hypothetical protein
LRLFATRAHWEKATAGVFVSTMIGDGRLITPLGTASQGFPHF